MMWLVISIFKIIIFAHDAYCDDLLSKFHQNDYMIRDVKLEVVRFNPDLMYSFNMIGHKYNRTVTGFNGTFRSKIDLEDKLEALVQLYKRASNEYRLFPVRYMVNVCKMLSINIIGLKSIPNYGIFPTYFWKKDIFYYAYNFPVDEKYLPPYMPHGEYRSEATLLHLERTVAVINGYAEVYSSEIKNQPKNG